MGRSLRFLAAQRMEEAPPLETYCGEKFLKTHTRAQKFLHEPKLLLYNAGSSFVSLTQTNETWRDGRAVECGGLENRCGGDSTGGSNPSPSVPMKLAPD